MSARTPQPLARITSLKVKLGLLVAASVCVAAVVATLGRAGGVTPWLSLPVTILLALAVTQLLAVGMTSPLREMTAAARRMATGDYDVRVSETSRDEVGELARAFNTMAHDLAGVDRQRRELVANVSHELRTPLAALTAVLENLLDGVGTPSPASPDPASLAPALAQAERLSSLVEDLLDLARVDAGKAPLLPQPVPLAPLLTEAVAEARILGRAVDYDLDVAEELVVRADPARLRQLVANLLDNASRHSPAGGRVLVRAARSAGAPTPAPAPASGTERYVLEVHDQGPGVAAADRERVFEPFGTLSTIAGGGGTGLGLAIARWVTELHGGSIAFVDPEPGATGARVRVELPLVPPDRPTPAPEVSVPAPAPASRPGASPGATAARTSGAAPGAVSAPSALDDVFGRFWPDRGVRARPVLLAGALATGLLAGLVLPFRHDVGLGLFLVLAAAGAVVLVASRHRRDPFTLACAVLSALLAAVMLLRDADWIAVLCMLAGAAVCVVGVTGARTVTGFVLSGVSWPLAGLRGMPWLGRTLVGLTGLGHGAAVLRTVVWSVLGLVVFGLLFASADAVLAEWVDRLVPDLSLGSIAPRLFVTVAVGGTVLAAAYLALNPPHVEREASATRTVGRRYEWLAPVLVVDAVFAAFLVAQAAVVFGGHDYLQRTTGLTYADYVHQGFGQLTVATALTLLVIWAAGRKAPRETSADRLWVRVSLGLLCLQTLVVVASALHRMHLYQEAYGFTRLRLLVDVFEGWLGLLVAAVVLAGIGLRGAWLARFGLLSGALALLGLALADPDAWIARHNVERYDQTGKVDWSYLRELSDDAVPVLADLPEPERTCALAGREQHDDWLDWSLGSSRATAVLGRSAGMAGPTGAMEQSCSE